MYIVIIILGALTGEGIPGVSAWYKTRHISDEINTYVTSVLGALVWLKSKLGSEGHC